MHLYDQFRSGANRYATPSETCFNPPSQHTVCVQIQNLAHTPFSYYSSFFYRCTIFNGHTQMITSPCT